MAGLPRAVSFRERMILQPERVIEKCAGSAGACRPLGVVGPQPTPVIQERPASPGRDERAGSVGSHITVTESNAHQEVAPGAVMRLTISHEAVATWDYAPARWAPLQR